MAEQRTHRPIGAGHAMSRHKPPRKRRSTERDDRTVGTATAAYHTVNLAGTAGVLLLAPGPAKTLAVPFAAASVLTAWFDRHDGLDGRAFDPKRRGTHARYPARITRASSRASRNASSERGSTPPSSSPDSDPLEAGAESSPSKPKQARESIHA